MNTHVALGLGFVAAMWLLAPTAPVQARIDCHPDCDFNHDYGPYDVGWERPGLTCYPRCDARGRCTPTATCVVVPGVAGQSPYATGWLDDRRPAGRVTVRPRRPAP